MLEGLDEIDWHALRHAYGPADDVPECIRDLASDDADLRREAMHELFGNIYHQGTVYEATAHAVPFLIELVATPSIADRDGILVLLAEIYNGGSYNADHQSLSLFAKDREKAEFKRQMELELLWVREARGAVSAGISIYRECLNDPDADVRLMAAYIIGAGSRPSRESYSALEARRVDETDSTAQAGQMLALGGIAKALGIRDSRLELDLAELFRSSSNPVIRLASAIALVQIQQDSAPETVIDLLVGANCRYDPELDDAWGTLPWNHGRLTVDAGIILARSIDDMDVYLDRIEHALKVRRTTADCDVAIGVLEAAFADSYAMRPASPPPFDSLTPFQRRALRFIAESDRAWSTAGSISSSIHARGFPLSHQDFCEYVNS